MKDPNKAITLNILLIGAGHMYLGLWAEGIARLLLTLGFGFIAIIYGIPDSYFYPMVALLNLWHGLDAYWKAKNMNQGEDTSRPSYDIGTSPHLPESPPPCPSCSRALMWVSQYSRWYCASCQQYFPRNAPPPITSSNVDKSQGDEDEKTRVW